MKTAGTLIQVMAFLTFLVGGLLGVLKLSDGTGVFIMIGAAISSVIIFAYGSVFVAIDDIAHDSRRSADAAERSAVALEQLTQRQRDAATRQRQTQQVKP